jgi:hypothetical protein
MSSIPSARRPSSNLVRPAFQQRRAAPHPPVRSPRRAQPGLRRRPRRSRAADDAVGTHEPERERRHNPAPELGQRGQGLARCRAGAVQEVHEPLDPPPDDGREAGPHDVLDGGQAPLTRSKTLVDRRVPETRIGATRGGRPPAPDIVAGTRRLAGVVSSAAGKPCRLRPASPRRRRTGSAQGSAPGPRGAGRAWRRGFPTPLKNPR